MPAKTSITLAVFNFLVLDSLKIVACTHHLLHKKISVGHLAHWPSFVSGFSNVL